MEIEVVDDADCVHFAIIEGRIGFLVPGVCGVVRGLGFDFPPRGFCEYDAVHERGSLIEFPIGDFPGI